MMPTFAKPSTGQSLVVLERSAEIAAMRNDYRRRIRAEMEDAIRRLGYGPGRYVCALRRPMPGE